MIIFSATSQRLAQLHHLKWYKSIKPQRPEFKMFLENVMMVITVGKMKACAWCPNDYVNLKVSLMRGSLWTVSCVYVGVGGLCAL